MNSVSHHPQRGIGDQVFCFFLFIFLESVPEDLMVSWILPILSTNLSLTCFTPLTCPAIFEIFLFCFWMKEFYEVICFLHVKIQTLILWNIFLECHRTVSFTQKLNKYYRYCKINESFHVTYLDLIVLCWFLMNVYILYISLYTTILVSTY